MKPADNWKDKEITSATVLLVQKSSVLLYKALNLVRDTNVALSSQGVGERGACTEKEQKKHLRLKRKGQMDWLAKAVFSRWSQYKVFFPAKFLFGRGR